VVNSVSGDTDTAAIGGTGASGSFRLQLKERTSPAIIMTNRTITPKVLCSFVKLVNFSMDSLHGFVEIKVIMVCHFKRKEYS